MVRRQIARRSLRASRCCRPTSTKFLCHHPSTTTMKYRHNRADRFPSPPLEERARERRPCPRNTLCAPEPTRWRSLLPLLLGRRDSPELFARIAPQNRPMEEVFSLSSSGGEGWGEEAVFPGGSWAGLGRGGALYLTNQANPPIGHCPAPVSQQLDEELDAPLSGFQLSPFPISAFPVVP